ncbi:MAG: hypothetical protein EAY66_01340 [Sphingobacteriales bacterium]|nr:MAG: hypothetical protein EAY66_01340 [Sphingobacteriales bacterium]
MQTINITAHTEDASQIEAIKAVIKAFKIKFSISKITDSAYNLKLSLVFLKLLIRLTTLILWL